MTLAEAEVHVVSDRELVQPSIGRASSVSCATRVPLASDDPGVIRAKVVSSPVISRPRRRWPRPVRSVVQCVRQLALVVQSAHDRNSPDRQWVVPDRRRARNERE